MSGYRPGGEDEDNREEKRTVWAEDKTARNFFLRSGLRMHSEDDADEFSYAYRFLVKFAKEYDLGLNEAFRFLLKFKKDYESDVEKLDREFNRERRLTWEKRNADAGKWKWVIISSLAALLTTLAGAFILAKWGLH